MYIIAVCVINIIRMSGWYFYVVCLVPAVINLLWTLSESTSCAMSSSRPRFWSCPFTSVYKHNPWRWKRNFIYITGSSCHLHAMFDYAVNFTWEYIVGTVIFSFLYSFLELPCLISIQNMTHADGRETSLITGSFCHTSCHVWLRGKSAGRVRNC